MKIKNEHIVAAAIILVIGFLLWLYVKTKPRVTAKPNPYAGPDTQIAGTDPTGTSDPQYFVFPPTIPPAQFYYPNNNGGTGPGAPPMPVWPKYLDDVPYVPQYATTPSKLPSVGGGCGCSPVASPCGCPSNCPDNSVYPDGSGSCMVATRQQQATQMGPQPATFPGWVAPVEYLTNQEMMNWNYFHGSELTVGPTSSDFGFVPPASPYIM